MRDGGAAVRASSTPIQLALGREVSTPAPDLLAVYLPGLDIAQHALLGGQDGRSPRSVVATRLDALRDYYVFLDRLLASSLRRQPTRWSCSSREPGRTTAAADGWLGLERTRGGARAEIAGRPTDVMPTVLHLLGVPISDELAGRPLTGLFAAQFVARYPVRQVARYGRPSASTAERTRTAARSGNDRSAQKPGVCQVRPRLTALPR